MLFAVGVTAGGPEDAHRKHDDENGNDEEWGTDIHVRYQRPHARVK